MDEKLIIDQLTGKFQETYGTSDARLFFAPGRVNLIGEHTDYNGGHVFPCALTIGTYAAAKKRDDRTVRFASMNIKGGAISEFSLDDPALHLDGSGTKEELSFGAGDWTAYPRGVIWAFANAGHKLDTGLDVMFYGNIPAGSGLSSSASLEVLTGLVLRELYGFEDVKQVDLAIYGQKAENVYVGMNCGIMDQFASAMGKEGHAIFLDTNTLEYENAPLDLTGMKIVITNSNVKHQLVTSGYNTRRSECEKALGILREKTGQAIDSLGALTPAAFDEISKFLGDSVIVSRAKHAVYENARTIDAVKALVEDNIDKFGKLMIDSHTSLRDDYEVSCPEIDFLVDEALKIPGVVGSRITGGGFGGCTVSIVKDEAIDEFKEKVGSAYEKKFGKKADFYVIEAGEGAHEIKLVHTPKRVLVTGGTGFIGSHTVVELIEAGYDVVIADNLYNSKKMVLDRIETITGVRPKFYEIDILDREALSKLFDENKIDAVIHFAGYKAVGESTRKPIEYYHNNLMTTLVLCDVMRQHNCKNIVFSSSATVYGDPAFVPITEECPLGETTNPYGTTKAMQERILTDIWKSDNEWKVMLLRYFNPIGAHESGLMGEDPKGIPNNLLPYVAQVASGKLEKIHVFGNDYDTPDGTGIRDYIHVVDLAKGHVKAIEGMDKLDGVNVFNLGTGIGYSVLDIIKAFDKACGKELPYVIDPRRPGDIATCYSDPKKAEEVLGWKAEKGIEEMCRDAWNWQTKNPEGYVE